MIIIIPRSQVVTKTESLGTLKWGFFMKMTRNCTTSRRLISQSFAYFIGKIGSNGAIPVANSSFYNGKHRNHRKCVWWHRFSIGWLGGLLTFFQKNWFLRCSKQKAGRGLEECTRCSAKDSNIIISSWLLIKVRFLTMHFIWEQLFWQYNKNFLFMVFDCFKEKKQIILF